MSLRLDLYRPLARSHSEGVEQDGRGLIRVGHAYIPNLRAGGSVVPGVHCNHDGVGIDHLHSRYFLLQSLSAFESYGRAVLKT